MAQLLEDVIDKNKIASGDEEEWAKLFKLYYPILSEHAHHILDDTHLADDIADAVILKLWEHRTTVTAIKFLKAYLIRATKNEVLSYIEKLSYKKEKLYPFDVEITAPIEKANDPVTIAQQKELRNKISIGIKKLAPSQRKVIDYILANLDVSTRALGKSIGCSHKNIQAIIRRIRIKFYPVRKLLEG